MPAPKQRGVLHRSQVPGPSLAIARERRREQLPGRRYPTLSKGLLPDRPRSYPRLLLRIALNLNQRTEAVHRSNWFIQQIEGAAIFVAVGESGPHRLPQPAQRTKSVIHRRGLIAAVHHAVGAFRIT